VLSCADDAGRCCGICDDVMTPTEAAVVAAAYAYIVGIPGIPPVSPDVRRRDRRPSDPSIGMLIASA
jgi:hypothetical protein